MSAAFDFVEASCALVVLVLPAWLVARELRLPHRFLAAFLISSLGLYLLVLGLSALGIPLTAPICGGAWVVLSLTAFFVLRTRRRLVVATDPPSGEAVSSWLALLIVPAALVAIYRATAQPLYGIDTGIRWSYLAEQMVARRSLAFYPPTSASDFAVYSWPESVTPYVSTLYFWTYALCGAIRPGLTAPVVILQYGLLVYATFALGRREYGTRAGWFAAGLLALSPLVIWSTVMGQETGITALAVVSLLLFLPPAATGARGSSIALAALAASAAALARQYGLIFPVFGLVALLVQRAPRRSVGQFLVLVGAVTLPWYLYTWLKTGNPLYSLDVAGLFPVNPIHALLEKSISEANKGALASSERWRIFFINAGALLAVGAAGAWLNRKQSLTVALAAAVVIILWVISIAHTAAGFTYALRVLNPGLALAAVLGGGALVKWLPAGRSNAVALGCLSLLVVDGSVRALTLPALAYRLPVRNWLSYGGALRGEFANRPIYPWFVQQAGPSRILTLGPNAWLTTLGATTAPMWSPELAFLFDPQVSAEDAARRLREANVGFILINRGPENGAFLTRCAFFRNPGKTLTVLLVDDEFLFLRVETGPVRHSSVGATPPEGSSRASKGYSG